MLRLYHPEVFMPPALRARLPIGELKLSFSDHARQEARQDGVRLPATLDTRRAELFEVATVNGIPMKMGYRVPLDERRDLCLIIALDGGYPYPVVTCWTNDRWDSHRTLNRRRYAVC